MFAHKETSAHLKAQSWAKRAYISVSSIFSSMTRWIPGCDTRTKRSDQAGGNGVSVSEFGPGNKYFFAWIPIVGLKGTVGSVRGPGHKGLSGDHYESWREYPVFSSAVDGLITLPPKCSNDLKNPSSGVTGHPLQPHEYKHAKKMLRRAVVEHYR